VRVASKAGMIPSSAVGLIAAVIATILQEVTPQGAGGATAAVLGVVAALCAAAGLLGPASVSATGAATVLFSGIAFAALQLAYLGLFFDVLSGFWLLFAIVGFVAYLIGATAYGFAGQAQGVAVGARTAVLVPLLLAVVPLANVVGTLGILIVSVLRKASSATSA
jgi:hypothetical protein